MAVILACLVLAVLGSLPDPHLELLFNNDSDPGVGLVGGATVTAGYLNLPSDSAAYASVDVARIVPDGSSGTMVLKVQWDSTRGINAILCFWYVTTDSLLCLYEKDGGYLKFQDNGSGSTLASTAPVFATGVASDHCIGITNAQDSSTFSMFHSDGSTSETVTSEFGALRLHNIPMTTSFLLGRRKANSASYHFTGKVHMLNTYASVLTEEQILEACTENYASAVGDPHITSIFGCHIQAPLNQTSAVLMECKDEKLTVLYNDEWGNHIHTVSIQSKTGQDNYLWKMMKHPKQKTVCGNTVEFHRYHAGINMRMLSVTNGDGITGMFADRSCLP